ncbi:hypothetical protein GW17_00028165 [Ensete ventricosum]|nr:hypothetical protein GW17_00028165 [Ensete ventricosum]
MLSDFTAMICTSSGRAPRRSPSGSSSASGRTPVHDTCASAMLRRITNELADHLHGLGGLTERGLRSVYLLTIEDDCLAVREDADSVTRQIILHTSKFHSPIFSSIGDFLSPQCERPRMVRPCKSVSAVPSIACIDLHMTKCNSTRFYYNALYLYDVSSIHPND